MSFMYNTPFPPDNCPGLSPSVPTVPSRPSQLEGWLQVPDSANDPGLTTYDQLLAADALNPATAYAESSCSETHTSTSDSSYWATPSGSLPDYQSSQFLNEASLRRGSIPFGTLLRSARPTRRLTALSRHLSERPDSDGCRGPSSQEKSTEQSSVSLKSSTMSTILSCWTSPVTCTSKHHPDPRTSIPDHSHHLPTRLGAHANTPDGLHRFTRGIASRPVGSFGPPAKRLFWRRCWTARRNIPVPPLFTFPAQPEPFLCR
jgi:hypothetical protein